MNINTEIILLEYDKLKDEQISRIAKRDGLIYVTLGVFGTIFSFSLINQKFSYILLIIPIISFILTWIYVSNDEKISDIGRYIRYEIIKRLVDNNSEIDDNVFGWEFYHRSGNLRHFRKTVQFIVEQVTFFISSFVGILIFIILTETISNLLLVIIVIDLIISLSIFFVILLHVDFKKEFYQ